MQAPPNRIPPSLLAALAMLALAACATEDPFRKQPLRVAYEIGDQVRVARPQFQSLWNWYLQAIDPKAPTTEVEVCLTVAPDGRVIDAYIDASTIRRKEFTEEIIKIYQAMRFAARDVPEATLCDDPLTFYALGDKPDPGAPDDDSAFAYAQPGAAQVAEPAPEPAAPPPETAPALPVPLKLDESLGRP